MGLLEFSPKVVAAIVVVVLLLIIVYFWRAKKTEKSSNKKGKKSVKKTLKKKISKAKPKSSPKTESAKDRDDDVEESEDEDEEDNVQELYNMIHENMVRGMTADEFKKVAGEYGNSMTYLNLKQLYNKAGDESEKAVTISQYRTVLNGEAE